MSDKRPNNQLVLAFAEVSRSEAPRDSVAGTESFAAKREAESPAREQLMEEVCGRQNCRQALARVNLQTATGEASRNTQAGRWGA